MITNSKTKGANTLPNVNNLSLLIVHVLAQSFSQLSDMESSLSINQNIRQKV